MMYRGAILWALLSAWSAGAFGATPQEDARALFDRWLDDQNRGDFDDYQTLYDGDFTGVRRSGTRTGTFDRRGWLQDRRPMFRKKMTVDASNVRVFASRASARIVFVQQWSSGRYNDVGPKHLILRRGPGGYHIVREELFASDTRAPGTVDLVAFHQLAFVVDGEVIISMHPDEGWAVGAAKIEAGKADSFLVRVERRVDPKKLPPGVADLAGTRVRLMDDRGVRCEAKLGVPFLRSRVVTDDTEDIPPEWSTTANFLVAKVEGDAKACAGATWARSAALPLPAIVAAEKPGADLEARALAAFQALPQSQAIQRRFARWYAHQHRGEPKRAPAWFAQEGAPAAVRLIRVKPAGPTLLSMSATMELGGCEQDAAIGSLWALWQVEGTPDNPRLTLRNQPDEAMTMEPTAAVDLDGDGRAELLFDGFSDYASANIFGQPQLLEHGFVRALGESYVDVVGPETPILICPC